MTAQFVVEPLTATHSRAGFHSGVEPLDRYFHTQVSQDVRRRATSSYVAVEAATARIAGYYTLSATHPMATCHTDELRLIEPAARRAREVVWRFSPDAAPHAGRYQFHPDQVLEPQDDGTLIVRFVASGHLEMAWHLYMWGDQVEVIRPTVLKKMTESYRRSDFPALP